LVVDNIQIYVYLCDFVALPFQEGNKMFPYKPFPAGNDYLHKRFK
jgi:hypothetical protein